MSLPADQGGTMNRLIVVRATWDDEAKVWVAESADLPGLVTEAESLDALDAKLPGLVQDAMFVAPVKEPPTATELLSRIRNIRIGGHVERCHTVLHHGSYSVAAHSWGVAMLMYVLWPEDFSRLAIYCLVHDIPEGWVGDVPATVKANNPVVKNAYTDMEAKIFDRLHIPDHSALSQADRDKLRAADHLELYLWADEQIKMGNLYVRAVKAALNGFFKERPLSEPANALYAQIGRNKWLGGDDSLTSVRDI